MCVCAYVRTCVRAYVRTRSAGGAAAASDRAARGAAEGAHWGFSHLFLHSASSTVIVRSRLATHSVAAEASDAHGATQSHTAPHSATLRHTAPHSATEPHGAVWRRHSGGVGWPQVTRA